MPWRLDTGTRDFEARFAKLLASREQAEADVDEVAAGIIADVRKRGDAALIELTERFDGIRLAPGTLRLPPAKITETAADCPADVTAALEEAAARIAAFHERQRPDIIDYTDAAGVRLGARWSPIAAVGIYVPGGLAAYPSSVLMNAVPARVAGVDRLVMVVPTPGGTLNPAVIKAAEIAGVDEIYTIGGAQAVAALAYGTDTIAPVDKIVGPGNAYVAAAKRRVFGKVGIDLIAGPSEILVVADARNDPEVIATDLLSQAEHDAMAQSILITDDEAFAEQVARAVEAVLAKLSRESIAARSWHDHGAVILARDPDQIPGLVDAIAPEHLELAVEEPDPLAARIRHAGAIFLGRQTPEAIGDYVAGPNHVLPTSGAARFSSGLNLLDFMKRTTFVGCTAEALAKIGPAAITLADAEGLEAHALSIRRRLNS